MSSFANALQLMVLGTSGAGKTAITEFLLREQLERPPSGKPVLVIDAERSERLSQIFWTPDELATGQGCLSSVVEQVAAHPEGESLWIDELVASAPVPIHERVDWLRIGPDWKEPDTVTQGRLSFSLRRFIRKTYGLVLIDGYSRFLLQVFQEEGLQPIIVATGDRVSSLNLEELDLALIETPPAIILTQAETVPLEAEGKHWLRQNERCPLLGRLPTLPKLQQLTPEEAKHLKNCFLRLDVAGLF